MQNLLFLPSHNLSKLTKRRDDVEFLHSKAWKNYIGDYGLKGCQIQIIQNAFVTMHSSLRLPNRTSGS